MKTISITLYKFEELSKEAQQKAIESNEYINVDNDFWSEYILEAFKETECMEIFEIENVYFSGFWSQGDGAMFEYTNISKKAFKNFLDQKYNYLTEKRKALLIDNLYISAKGRHFGHYYHENSCEHSINIELNQSFNYYKHSNICNLINEINEAFEDYLIRIYKNKCRELYKTLEEEYTYMLSEESIKQTLISFDYDFTENGEIY